MNVITAKAILEELLEAYDTWEHGDYFYDNGDVVCEAVACILEQPEWISVSDHLPNDTEKVLVYTTTGNTTVARWSQRQEKFVASGNITVTHWMALPEKPEVEV
jgi:hypothetical protein